MSERTSTLRNARTAKTLLAIATALVVSLFASPLTATAGAAPLAGVSPGSLAFNATVGTTTSAQPVTLANTGDTPLTIAGVALGGANAGEFAIANGCAATLPANATCAVSVTFTPAAAGSRTATLTFTDDHNGTAGATQTVALSGDGAEGLRGRVDFTAAAGTTSGPQAVTLTNAGGSPLGDVQVAIVGEHFAISGSTCGPTVEAGASCSVSATFSPPAEGAFAATLRFTTSDPGNAVVDVGLFGTGTPAGSAPADGGGGGGGTVVTLGADRDRDGVPDALDRCLVTPGDLLNGCASELAADVRGRWRVNDLVSQLLSLTVRAPLGSRIVLECKGRKGVCNFSKREIKKTTKRLTSLTRSFKGRRLFPAGTVITVRVTRPIQYGTFERLVTRSGSRLPKVTNRCLNATGRVQPCR